MNVTRLSAVLILALALVVGGMVAVPGAAAEANPDDGKTECVADCGGEVAPVDDGKKDDGGDDDEGPVVTITGGTVTSDTTIDISANGGTAISDASGGDLNAAVVTDVGGDVDDDGDGIVDGDIAAAGNGGTADASADGGAVSVGDINSGGNNGGVIVVGNVGAPAPEAPKPEAPKPVEPKPVAPKPVEPKPVAPKPTYPDAKPDAPKVVVVAPKGGKDNGGGGNAGGGKADRVKGLPATGAGLVQGESDVNVALIALAAIGALGAAGYGLRRRVA